MSITLPDMIFLQEHGGDYSLYIDAIYCVFENDFVKTKPLFRGKRLALKYHPEFQGRAYTFYHMTHVGKDEADRQPDLRRCERIPYARPVIERCDFWKLKIWPQKRGNKNRLCIWLERGEEPDYFVILDIRTNYILPWTAFVARHEHEKRKKKKEYEAYLKSQKPPSSQA
jgi:hypothetical protein